MLNVMNCCFLLHAVEEVTMGQRVMPRFFFMFLAATTRLVRLVVRTSPSRTLISPRTMALFHLDPFCLRQVPERFVPPSWPSQSKPLRSILSYFFIPKV
jgi:hypothetical protein